MYAGELVSNWLMNHIRDCASDSGIRSGRGLGASSGRACAPPEREVVSSASSATVGWSKMSRTLISMPSAACTRAATRVAPSEVPPMSKNESVALTCGRLAMSPKTLATASSAAVRGAMYSAALSMNSGSGRALRSSLPFAVSGNASNSMMALGTM